MKNIYIHIGLNKTGSTTLQTFLSANNKQLLSQNCLYPQAGRLNQVGLKAIAHFDLKNFYKGHSSNLYQIFWKNFHQEIELTEADNVIISCEGFSSFQLPQIAYIKSDLSKYNVKVIVYLRRQDKWILSCYSQQVKTGKLSDSLDVFLNSSPCLERLNYYNLLLGWSSCFGAENIIVRPLEKMQISDINRDILEVLGIKNIDKFNFTTDKNISPNQKIIEILKFINQILFKQLNLPKDKSFPLFKQPILGSYSHNKIFTNDHKKYDFIISPKKILEILDKSEESNKKIAKGYLSREDGILFYENIDVINDSRDTNSFKIDELNNEDLQEIILCISNQIIKNNKNDVTVKKYLHHLRNSLLNDSTINNKIKLRKYLVKVSKKLKLIS